MEKLIVLVLAFLLCLSWPASAERGTANFFAAENFWPSCTVRSGTGVKGGGAVFSAKASDALWNNGAACGKHYSVACIGGILPSQASPCRGQKYIVVKIDAHCPNCDATIGISHYGFAAIADPNVHKIHINYFAQGGNT